METFLTELINEGMEEIAEEQRMSEREEAERKQAAEIRKKLLIAEFSELTVDDLPEEFIDKIATISKRQLSTLVEYRASTDADSENLLAPIYVELAISAGHPKSMQMGFYSASYDDEGQLTWHSRYPTPSIYQAYAKARAEYEQYQEKVAAAEEKKIEKTLFNTVKYKLEKRDVENHLRSTISGDMTDMQSIAISLAMLAYMKFTE